MALVVCGPQLAQAQTNTPGVNQGMIFPPPSPPPQPIQAPPTTYVAPPPSTYTVAPAVSTPPPAATTPTAPSVVVAPAIPEPSALPPPVAPPQGANVAPWPPAVLPYREGMPIVPGYRLESEMRSGLALGGLAVIGVPYAAGLIAAAASGFSKGSGWLAVPLAGPFVAMGGRSIDCSFTNVTGTDATVDINKKEAECRQSAIKEARVVALLTVAGLVQTAGAIMTIAGLATQDKTLVRKDLYPETDEVEPRFSFDGSYEPGRFRLTARYNF